MTYYRGVLIGAGLAFVTAQLYARIKATKVNGWITMFGLGRPSNGRLFQAAAAQLFPGPVNVPEEAMYWWTNVDGAGPVPAFCPRPPARHTPWVSPDTVSMLLA